MENQEHIENIDNIEGLEATENGIEIDAIVPSEIFGKVRPFIPGWQEPHEAWEL